MNKENILDHRFFVRSTHFDGRISVHRVWNKEWEGRPKKFLLFVSSATLSADMVCGVTFEGYSWMDYMAAQGYECFAIDVRGYGHSSQYEKIVIENGVQTRQFLTSHDSANDVIDVINNDQFTIDSNKLVGIGYSWSCTIWLRLQEINPSLTQKMILINPIWLSPHRTIPKTSLEEINRQFATACKVNYIDQLWQRYVSGAGGRKLHYPDWHEAITRELMKFEGFKKEDRSWITPIGITRETSIKTLENRPLTDLAYVACPTHLLSCEYDTEYPIYLVEEILMQLKSDVKTLNVVPGGSHFMCWEMKRTILFDMVSSLSLN